MTDRWVEESLRAEAGELAAYLRDALTAAIEGLDRRLALPPSSASALVELDEPLPDAGCGARAVSE